MKGFLNGIIVTIVGGLLVLAFWQFINKIDTGKIIAYLPYANDYVYTNGERYKGAASDPPHQMPRNIDPNTPIPLNISKGKQKLTIGVRNDNLKPIDNVRLFLTMPDKFDVTEHNPWQNYTDKSYNISLGNINSGVGHNAVEPIFFVAKKTGRYKIEYAIRGRNFAPINRVITFDVYDKN